MKELQTLSTNTFRYKPIDGYMQEYFNKVNVNYNYNLSGNSINATLYKFDSENSTVSEGAKSAMRKVGEESPIRYIRVDNVPIFNVTQVDMQMNFTEEYGYSTDVRLDCIVQPSNLSIEVGDFIKLDYSDFSNLFEVVECSPSTFESVYYNKLSLKATQHTQENIEFQTLKRMHYVYESGAILDKNLNDLINGVLDISNNFYKDFLSEFYSSHGIIIKKDDLNRFKTKFFKFKDLWDDIKVYSYFFKRFISTTLISVHIEHKELINRFMNYENDDTAFKSLETDDAKLIYKLTTILQREDKTFHMALMEAFYFMVDDRTNNLINEPSIAKEKYENIYKNFFDGDFDFYRLLLTTSKLLEEYNVSYTDEKVIKIYSNIKKLLKYIKDPYGNYSLLKSCLFLIIIKNIPFKNISFNTRNMEYGV